MDIGQFFSWAPLFSNLLLYLLVLVNVAVSRTDATVRTILLRVLLGQFFILPVDDELGLVGFEHEVGFHPGKDRRPVLLHPFILEILFVGLTVQFSIDQVGDPIFQKELGRRTIDGSHGHESFCRRGRKEQQQRRELGGRQGRRKGRHCHGVVVVSEDDFL
jgi:hypothetical protein